MIDEFRIEKRQAAGHIAKQVAGCQARPELSGRHEIDVEGDRIGLRCELQVIDEIVPVQSGEIPFDAKYQRSGLEVVPGLKTADDTLVVDIAELDWSGPRKVGR